MRIVDLSIALENGVPADPPGYEFEIDYITHNNTVPTLQERYDGLQAKELIGEEAFALESIRLSSHNGTHVDSPWHYGSRMTDGSRARTIDEIPLDWFYRPGIKLDFRQFPDGYIVTAEDIAAELDRIGYELQSYDIVLMNTCAGARFGQKDYPFSGCGFGRDATMYLTDHGVRVVGTDAWSWDAPYKYVAQRYARDRDGSIIWEGHKAGLEREYCQIEKVFGLAELPATGFRVACFPVKIHAASAGWTRAVAIFDE
ncbi:MAG: cyclase family protein [Oleispira sp.]|nr:cyclase family protein [Oleispira sp.]